MLIRKCLMLDIIHLNNACPRLHSRSPRRVASSRKNTFQSFGWDAVCLCVAAGKCLKEKQMHFLLFKWIEWTEEDCWRDPLRRGDGEMRRG